MNILINIFDNILLEEIIKREMKIKKSIFIIKITSIINWIEWNESINIFKIIYLYLNETEEICPEKLSYFYSFC